MVKGIFDDAFGAASDFMEYKMVMEDEEDSEKEDLEEIEDEDFSCEDD